MCLCNITSKILKSSVICLRFGTCEIERSDSASLSFKDVGAGVAVAGHIATASTGTVTLSSQSRKGLVFIILVTRKSKFLP